MNQVKGKIRGTEDGSEDGPRKRTGGVYEASKLSTVRAENKGAGSQKGVCRPVRHSKELRLWLMSLEKP